MRALHRSPLTLLATALVLVACGGPISGSTAARGPGELSIAGEESRGGVLRFANAGDWDSLDPAGVSHAYSRNFARNYGRSLVMFAPAAGQQGATLVPDLAESLGRASDGARTWTYTLRPGVRFEDGTPVTSEDVKYAVERSLDGTAFPRGPAYLGDVLDARGYPGGMAAIDTPDERTIVFHLRKPFSGFDYLAQTPATMPVPRGKDTGTRYQEHVISTGPYMFASYEPGRRFTMIRNPHWDPATDPNRHPLPEKITVELNVNPEELDNRLVSGDLDVPVQGSGIGPATQDRILADESLRANTDTALAARLWYTALNPDVEPLDNAHCRKAVLFAADRVGYQSAYGGMAGGEIATNVLPPVIPGATQFDLYRSNDHLGDTVKARAELAQCGRPRGFTTGISYRAERAEERAAAEALRRSLDRVGIRLEVTPYPEGGYSQRYAGNPDYAKSHGLGLMVHGWSAGWPEGYGFLAQIVDSRAIRASGGNSNLGIKDPVIDRMLDRALLTTDTAQRQRIWAGIDREVMEQAFILPGVWARSLLYRPPNLTNVFITDGFQMFDYTALGTTRK